VVVQVGQQTGGSSQEMELRALVEAVKMAEGPRTVVSGLSVLKMHSLPRSSRVAWSFLSAGGVRRSCWSLLLLESKY
jgi:hypothetical protein